MTLTEISHEVVAPYKSLAAKEHVSLAPTKRTRWFEAPGKEGFCALINIGKDRGRIKGVYVHPEFRGRGLGTEMTEALMILAGGLGYSYLEAIALNPKFYEARGFKKKVKVHSGWRMTRP